MGSAFFCRRCAGRIGRRGAGWEEDEEAYPSPPVSSGIE